MLWTTGVAVGCGWQAFVAYVNVGCYYVVGVPLGVFLGFYLDLGAKVRTCVARQPQHGPQIPM
jgi:Na+-driven multidrug efflux pump